MFDRIVEPVDGEARKRDAVSLAVTGALSTAAVVGFVVGSFVWFVAPAPAPQPEPPVVMLPQGGGGPPDLPELPRAPRERMEPTEVDPDALPDPEAAPTETQPNPTPHDPGTGDLGDGGGKGGGHTTGIGTPIGTADEADEGDVRIAHYAPPEVKRRFQPRYPDELREDGLGEQRCTAVVRLDAQGVPYEVDVTGCPEAFWAPTRSALLKWRWYPARDGHAKIASQTTLSVVYRLEE
jgi:hypothetical protein